MPIMIEVREKKRPKRDPVPRPFQLPDSPQKEQDEDNDEFGWAFSPAHDRPVSIEPIVPQTPGRTSVPVHSLLRPGRETPITPDMTYQQSMFLLGRPMVPGSPRMDLNDTFHQTRWAFRQEMPKYGSPVLDLPNITPIPPVQSPARPISASSSLVYTSSSCSLHSVISLPPTPAPAPFAGPPTHQSFDTLPVRPWKKTHKSRLTKVTNHSPYTSVPSGTAPVDPIRYIPFDHETVDNFNAAPLPGPVGEESFNHRGPSSLLVTSHGHISLLSNAVMSTRHEYFSRHHQRAARMHRSVSTNDVLNQTDHDDNNHSVHSLPDTEGATNNMDIDVISAPSDMFEPEETDGTDNKTKTSCFSCLKIKKKTNGEGKDKKVKKKTAIRRFFGRLAKVFTRNK